jgi:23S rRNA (cytosine1962-C5)-methyltransferase
MLYPTTWKTYELIDFGEGRKLERYGDLLIDRPEPSAKSRKTIPQSWNDAIYRFYEEKGQKGSWDAEIKPFQIQYQLDTQDLTFNLKQTAFKHLGISPEQAVNWQFIANHCHQFQNVGTQPNVLNLFAYTGAASLVADRYGATVTHVDSSKSVVQWARENAELNNISSIRWIVEDARKFVERAIK